jgi:DNA-binding NarL/FixJ family response regulator
METVKKFSNNNLSVESSLSLAAPDDAVKEGNVFFIGLNFNDNAGLNGEKRDLQASKNKIPILMLKIDANKIISAQTVNGKDDLEEIDEARHNLNAENPKNDNPIKEIYSLDYEHMDKELPHENLSFREMQVMKLIALGKTRKEIADELSLSISTIDTYRTRTLEKMYMKNNAEIMRYSFQHKLIE